MIKPLPLHYLILLCLLTCCNVTGYSVETSAQQLPDVEYAYVLGSAKFYNGSVQTKYGGVIDYKNSLDDRTWRLRDSSKRYFLIKLTPGRYFIERMQVYNEYREHQGYKADNYYLSTNKTQPALLSVLDILTAFKPRYLGPKQIVNNNSYGYIDLKAGEISYIGDLSLYLVYNGQQKPPLELMIDGVKRKVHRPIEPKFNLKIADNFTAAKAWLKQEYPKLKANLVKKLHKMPNKVSSINK